MLTRRNLLLGGLLFAGGCSAHENEYEQAGFDPGPGFPFWKAPEKPGHPPADSISTGVSVRWPHGHAANTIVVETSQRKLYYVYAPGEALRYDVGIGREGSEFRGVAVVGRKAEWPSWRPTDEMLRREPERYRQYAAGVPGGPGNPLGARALYLYQNGQDTLFRIHGTDRPATIGSASSAGCIRMHNMDVIDLYARVAPATPVIVR